MEIEQPRNGDGKVLTREAASTGRRRHGPLSMYLDISKDVDAGRVPRLMPPAEGMGSRRRTYDDGELDVFAAERYFKGAMDGDAGRKESRVAAVVPAVETAAAARHAEAAAAVAKSASTRASVASVSASSATSFNSQTVLLRGGPRRREQKCCVHVGVLMRSCSGKRSVHVESGATREVTGAGEPEASMVDWYKELRIQKAALGVAGHGDSHGVVAAGLPPNLNLGTVKVAAIGRDLMREEKAAEFTSSSSRRRSFTLVAPVRASMAPGASGRGPDGGGGGGNKKGDGREHDHDNDDGAGSESSSDLFEIKSLMIEDCPYEPSETSVQWSVVTADASERGDRVPSRRIGTISNGGRGTPVSGRQSREYRPAGLFAGCVSHRAVDVSPATAMPTVATGRRIQ